MSLLEVMVVIAILMVMSVLTYEALASAIDMRDALSERDATSRAARVAMSKISREIRLAWLTKHVEAVNTFYTVFVGTPGQPADTLWMSTLSHQRLYRDSRECDETEITLWTEESKDREKGLVLYHREAPFIDNLPDQGGVIYPLAYGVQSFNLMYLDQTTGTWVNTWDSRAPDTSQRLPRAIEVSLVLSVSDGSGGRPVDVPFVQDIELEYAPPMQVLFNPNGTGSGGNGGGGSGGTAPGNFTGQGTSLTQSMGVGGPMTGGGMPH